MKKRIAIDLNDTCRSYSNSLITYYNRWDERDKSFDPDNVKYREGDMFSCIPFRSDKERIDFITINYVYEINACPKPLPFFEGRFITFHNDMLDEFENDIEILVVSPFECELERQATFFFLSKACMRVKKVLFPSTIKELWDNADILITANPKLLMDVPDGKTTIKIKTKYNKKSKSTYSFDSIMDIISEENQEKIKSIIKS